MKEGIGNTIVLMMVMIFVVFISSYLAFTINYSKAFKVKSKIIDIIEKYNNDMTDNRIGTEIQTYIDSIGYSVNNIMISENCVKAGYDILEGQTNQGWCYKVIPPRSEANKNKNEAGEVRQYVKIKTFISIDIPIINRIFSGVRFFTVEGSTKPTYVKPKN